MKFGKRFLACLTLLVIALASVGVFAACSGDNGNQSDSGNTSAPTNVTWSDTYYCDVNGAEWNLVINNDGTYTLTAGSTVTGNYSYDGTTLSLNNAQYRVSYSKSSETITLTFDNQTYTFLEKVEYTVTFDSNGGSAVAASKVINGRTLSKPADPEKEGMTFIGWYKDSALKTQFAFGSEPVTGNMTLYARYTENGQAADEFTVSFSLNGKQGTAPASIQTVGGVAYNLPTPEVAGETFVGWYYSAYNDGSKLSYEYTEQVLTADTTLFAVWQSDGLTVSVAQGLISWTSAGANVNYTLNILNKTTNTPFTRTRIGTTSQAYNFNSAGEYEITVTSSNNMTGTAYYKFRVLDATELTIVDNTLVYTPVDNAEKYYVTVECGTSAHTHTDLDNGSSLYYDFSSCDMTTDGIKFTVTAYADGYVSSTSTTYVLVRNLDNVTGLAVDANSVASWKAVENATSYVLAITYNGETVTLPLGNVTSYDLKEYGVGNIDLAVYAVAHGYNNSAAANYTYAKTMLPSPSDVNFEGQTASWTAVAGAVSYNVDVDGTVFNVTGTSFTFDENVLVAGKTEYVVKVQAVAATAANNSVYSDAKTLSYAFDTAYYADGKLNWNAYAGASYYNVYLNGERVAYTNEMSYTFSYTQAGENTVGVAYVDKNGDQSAVLEVKVQVYEVTLDVDGGVEVDEEGQNITVTKLFLATGDAVNLSTAVTKRGYTFGGWYDRKGGPANYGNQYTDTNYQDAAARTLYAYWEANVYTVSLYYSDNAVLTQNITYGSAYTMSIPENTNVLYAFAGWYGDINGAGAQYTDEHGVGVAAWSRLQNVNLYPYWVAVFEFEEISSNGVDGYRVTKAAGIDFITEATIPATYLNKPVLAISSAGFRNTTGLRRINIPDSIEDCAESTSFDNCTALEFINVYKVEGNHDVVYGSANGVLFKDNAYNGVEMVLAPLAMTGELVIPSHVTFREADGERPVTTLPVNAFRNSKLSKITIPYTVSALQTGCFESAANLVDIEFEATPEGEADVPLAISAGAFRSLTNLTALTLPARISTFDPKAVESCANLAEINVAGNGGNYSSVGGVLTNAAKTEIVYVPAAFGGDKNDQGEFTGKYVIPEGVTRIGANAFSYNTVISEVVFPAWVTYIGVEAFAKRSTSDVLTSNTTITSISFLGNESSPDLTIDDLAFYYCNQIENLTIPANCKKIGASAFGYTNKVTTVYVESNGEVDFADRAFGTNPTSSTSTITYYVTTLYIGKNVGPFSISGVFGPTTLSVIVIDPENENFYADEYNIVYDKDVTQLLYVPRDVAGEYVSPNTLKEIGAGAFNARTGLTKVTIGYSVERIGSDAFTGCTALTDVIFAPTPDGAELVSLEIGNQAFRGCTHLTSVEFPERLKVLGSTIFFGDTALQSISLPSTLETINLGYELVTIDGEQIEFNYIDAFLIAASRTTPVLSSITVAAGNTHYAAIENVVYELDEDGNPVKLLAVAQGYLGDETGSVHVPATVNSIETRAFYYAQVTNVVFPEKVDSSFTVKPYAFYYCSIQTLTLPVGMTTIGSRALYYAYYTNEIVVPYTVTSIQNAAFYYCYNMTKLTFQETPEGETVRDLRIEDAIVSAGASATATNTTAAFYYLYNLKELILPERLTYIGKYAFNYTVYVVNLTKIVIPSTVEEIADHAFFYSSANTSKTMTIEFATRTEVDAETGEEKQVANLKKIGDYAFYYQRFANIILPDSVQEIGERAFYYNRDLTNLYLGKNLQTIGQYAFYYCDLITSVTIPATIKTIGQNAFYYTTAMKSITFEVDEVTGLSNLQSIGASCFYGSGITSFTFPETANEIVIGADGTKRIFNTCKSLTKVTLNSTLSDIDDLFYGCSSIREFEVPDANENFSELPGYPLLMNHDGTVVRLCTSVNGQLTLPEGIVEIGDAAFYGVTGLIRIVMPTTLYKIGAAAFQGCTGLTEVVFSTDADGKTAFAEMADHAFYGCSALTTFRIPTSSELEELPEYAFYGCTNLVNFTFSAKIKSIGRYSLYNCTSLILRELPSTLTYIGGYSFYHSMLAQATIAGTATIEDHAFYYAQELSSVTIEDGVKAIPAQAFYYCTALTSIYIPASVTAIGNQAFYYCTALQNVEFGKDAAGNYGKTTMGYQVFYHTDSLRKIFLPGTLVYTMGTSTTTGSNGLFYYSGVEEVEFGEGTTMIPGYSFYYDTSIRSVTIPHTVTTIGLDAFYYSGLEEITIPYSVTSIGNYAFASPSTATYQNLRKVTFEETPAGVTASPLTIGTYTFYYQTNLEEVIFPDRLRFTAAGTSTTASGYYTFAYSGVKHVKLPSNLTIIPYYFFGRAENLESIDIPSTVTTIGNYAFAYTGEIEKITIPAGVKINSASTSTYMFYYSGVKEIEVLGSWTALPNYFAAYAESLEKVTLPDTITTLGTYTFEYTSSLKEAPDLSKTRVTAVGSSTYTFYHSAIESFEIPAGWTAIPNATFYYCENIKEITIPSAIKAVGTYAFAYTTSLEKLEIPSSIPVSSWGGTSSSTAALYHSGIKEITIPSTWKTIPSYFLSYCQNITEFTLPAGITSIPTYAFYYAENIKELVIPDTVTSVGTYAFAYTTSLERIDIPSKVAAASWGNYALSHSGIKEITVPDSWTALPAYFLYYCENITEFTISDKVKTIGNYAFYYTTSLKEMVIPDTVNPVTSISTSTYLFYYSGVEKVVIPSNWTAIPTDMFYHCDKLTDFTIPSKVTAIGNYAFAYTHLADDLVLPSTLKTLGNYVFYYSTVKSVFIPNSINDIGYYSFAYMPNLTSVTFDDNFKALTLGYELFYNSTKLKEVNNFPSVVKPTAVSNTSISVAGSLGGLFYNTAVENFVIPSDWEYVPYYFMRGNTGVKSITLPKSLKAVGSYAFYGCTALEEVLCEDGMGKVDVGGSVFTNDANLKVCELTGHITCTAVGSSTATTADVFFLQGTAIEEAVIPEDWTAIAYAMFDGCANLKSVTIPANVTAIGTYAFRGCESLEELNFAEGSKLNAIGGAAFMGTTALKYAELPEGVLVTAVGSGSATGGTTNGSSMFYNSGVEEVVLPSTLEILPAQMFSGCTNLKKLTIKGNLTNSYSTYYPGYSSSSTSTVDYATYATFYGCESLEEVIFEGNDITIGNNLFNGLDTNNPTKITFKGTVASMGQLVFANTSGIAELVFEKDVSVVMGGAFSSAEDLAKVTFMGNVDTFGSTANINLNINGTTYTGANTMSNCPSLTELTFMGDIGTVGSYSFAFDTALKSVELNTVFLLGDYAFAGCTALEDFKYENLLGIGGYVFAYTESLKTFNLPASLVISSVYDTVGMFYDSAIEEITLPAGVTAIPNSFFSGCTSLTKVETLGTITAYGDSAFFRVPLNNLEGGFAIPDTVTYIGSNAFNETGLTELNIPKSVTEIGNGAFAWLYFGEGKFTIDPLNPVFAIDDQGNLYNKSTKAILMVPCSTTGTYTISKDYVYQPEAFHGALISKVIFEEGYVDIAEYLCYDMPELTEVVLPSTIKSIGAYAFSNCPKLTSIAIPNSVEIIDRRAFWADGGLKSVTIGTGVTELGEYAFSRTGLTSITIPANVELFGQYIFWQCYDLKEVTFSGERDTIMGPTASTNLNLFHSCSSLETVTLPADLKVARGLFGYADSDKLTIAGGLKMVAPYMFYYCYAKEIVLPETVTEIGQYGFEYANKLENFVIPASVKTLGSYALAYSGIASSEANDYKDTTLTISGDFTTRATYAFYHIYYNTVKFAEGIESIDTTSNGAYTTTTYGLFYYAESVNLIFPSTLKSLAADYLVYYSHFAMVDLSKTQLTALPQYIFYQVSTASYCYLTDVRLPNTIKEIGNYAFYYERLVESIDLTGIEKIGNYAFYYCQGLTNIDLSKATEIGPYAFYYCQGLTKLDLSSLEWADYYSFYHTDNVSEGIVFGPDFKGTRNTYSATSTSSESFYYCGAPYYVIPESATKFDSYFIDCPLHGCTVYMERKSSEGMRLASNWLYSSASYGTATLVWGSKGPVSLDAGIWDVEDATERYAAYFYNSDTNESVWVDLTLGEDGLYSAAAPVGYDYVIFVRMDGESTENSWDNAWNQTENLLVTGYYCKTFTINSWGEGGNSQGAWN